MTDTLRLLIVDDSPDDAFLIADALTRENVEVVVNRVDDGASLRNALASAVWDIVLIDYSMPCLTAEEGLRIIREVAARLPIIVVSGVIGEERAVEMMRAGAADYVMKDRLARLLPAIRREIRDAAERQTRDREAAALNELRARLQTTVERAPVGIANVGRDGRFLHVNRRWCEIVGYSSDELLAMRFADITHPDERHRDIEKLIEMASGALDEYQTEKRYIRRDGSIVWISLNTAPIRDAAGRFQYFATIALDITEKRAMETALRERDARYGQIVNTAQEGIWTVDAADRTTFVNLRMAEMLGYEPEEMLGRPVSDFVHGDGAAAAQATREGRHAASPAERQFILKRKDGATIRVQFSSSPLRADDGAQVGSLAMVSDVTARWIAERTVLRQKRELEEAQRIAHIGSWRRDLPGDTLEWSEELYRIFGVDPSITPTISSLVQSLVPEDRDPLVKMIADSHEFGTPIDLEYRIRRPDGTVRTLLTHGEITRDEAGVPIEIRGVSQDITELVAAAAAQRSLNRHLQLLLESTTQGIFGIGVDGRCTFVNRAASDILGFARGELAGKLIHDVLHPAQHGAPCSEAGCAMEIAARTGAAIEGQSGTLFRRDGTMLPVEYSAAPIIDNGVVEGAVVVFTDVSERKLLQAQLEQSDRVSRLGRLAATMAHEFNNVLMGIQPFAELLTRQRDEATIGRATQNIQLAVHRGRSISQSVLRFARPAELLKEEIEVRGWLQSLESSLAVVLGPNIAMDLRVDGERLFIRGDRHQLEQVLMNLATNARDAMNGVGGFSILVKRCLSGYVFPFGAIRTADQYLHISVSDTGCGMDEKTLRDIFDPFFTTKRSGTGLGLAVVHQVMEQHGGSVIAESTIGSGTTFHLFTPLAEKAFSEAPLTEEVAVMPQIAKVLIVEDDEAIATGVADLLRDEGIEVEVARTGRLALTALANHVPDVVILDVGLPDIDGCALYENIVAQHPSLAVVFASGGTDSALLQPYLQPGRTASLSKPYEFDALMHVLGSFNPASTSTEASS